MAITAFKPQPVFKGAELTDDAIRAYAAGADEPGWLADARRRAADAFNRTPAPVKNDELWRRVDLSRFKLAEPLADLTAVHTPDVDPAWAPLATKTDAPGWILHSNGQCVDFHVAPELTAQGVLFTTLEAAAKHSRDVLDRYMMTQCVKPTDSYFAAMHAALVRGGVVLYVPKGVTIDRPLRAATWMTADQRTAFHHTLIVIEDGAKATLIEEFASATPPAGANGHAAGGPAMVNSAVEIILGKGAQLDYVSTQDWARNVYNFSTERAHVGEGATLHWVLGGIGARFTKSAIEADMLGDHGTALLSGVYFADTKQQFHYDTQQNHIGQACKSDLLYKAALRDESRAVWRGNIRVFPGAQKTDGYQANRNLQLSDKSRADSIPGLEIEADDVRCTHGATVGQIEAEPMFYLESRGIPDNEARRLIVEGFFAPVIERIPLQETRDRLTEEIGRKIG